MKKLIILSFVISLTACGESKKEEPAMIKKIVCADSVEQEMFDQNGNSFIVRMPGKCDTILEPAPEN